MSRKLKDRKAGIRIWAIISALALVIILVVTMIVTNREYSHVLDILMGGKRAILAGSDDAIFLTDDGVATKADATAYGDRVNIELCEEGFVLLKNEDDALPLKKAAKVSVFGKNSVNLVLSGSGSAGTGTDGSKTIFDSLTAAGIAWNPDLKAFYENRSLSGDGRTANPKIENSGNVILSTGETPQSAYSAVRSSYAAYHDAAIIVFSRIGGEGFDLPRTQKEDASRHYLQLDANEEALIAEVTNAGFEKVIVVINSANPMELGFVKENDKIDAALWIGNVGSQGIMALGSILSGEVNPSGRLPDTYAADFRKDPVWQNFGDNGNENGDRFIYGGKNSNYYFVDYEEGIYLGYRYYETVPATMETGGEDWYWENVVFPFGYGLSYSGFDWELKEVSGKQIEKDTEITVKVEVTNSGSRAGKDVVQIYAQAPYDSKIEKSAKVLVAFAKTDLLQPGGSQELTLTVNPYSMASYDFNDANGNGFKGYELESGDYILHISENAHDAVISVDCSVEEGITWETDAYTAGDTKIENRFADSSEHIDAFLSRRDFAGTFPASPAEGNRLLSDEMRTALKDTKSTGNPIAVQTVEMPVSGADNGLVLKNLYGKSFDDPMWEDLLDQITFDEMIEMQMFASFNTNDIESVAKPKTTDADGPNGFTNFMGDPTVYGTAKYCCEGIMAATFNTDLMRKLGNAVGNESLMGNEDGDGMPYTGWYAPAMNLHRGQFGGRDCEYFSEDPFLSGMMGAYEILGCNDKGMVTYVKHFVGNEQETHRAVNGNCTFTNEQALRELYLKPFELAVKIGGTKAIMTSFNRIGTKWTGGDYRLLTEVLRNEWGFHGAVITDFNTNPNYMNTRQMAFAGGTLDLASQPHDWADTESALDMYILRRNTHETLYAIANSNVMNKSISGYQMSYWRIALIVTDVVVVSAVIVSGFLIFFPKGKKHAGEA